MSFGRPYGRRNQVESLLSGLFQGLQAAQQGFQVGNENRRRDRLDQQAEADRQQQIAWHNDAIGRQNRLDEAAALRQQAELDPDNAQRLGLRALAAQKGVTLPQVPQTPIFGGLGSGLASRLQQGALQDRSDTSTLGLPGITPGRTPQQIALEQALAKFERERLAKQEDQRATLAQQLLLSQQNQAAQDRRAQSALTGTFIGQGYEPDLARAGAEETFTRQPAYPQPQGEREAIQLLRGLGMGAAGGPAVGNVAGQIPEAQRLVSALSRMQQSPRVQSALSRDRAAEEASKANTALIGERAETERIMRLPKLRDLEAGIRLKGWNEQQVRARIADMRAHRIHVDRQDELAALRYVQDVRANQALQADRAAGRGLERERLDLDREKLAWDREQWAQNAPLRAAQMEKATQEAAKLNPATQAKVKTIQQRIRTIESQINRLEMQGLDGTAGAYEGADKLRNENLPALLEEQDRLLNAPGAVTDGGSRGSERPSAPAPRVSGGKNARARFIAEMRRIGYTTEEAARKADAVGIR